MMRAMNRHERELERAASYPKKRDHLIMIRIKEDLARGDCDAFRISARPSGVHLKSESSG